jgi:two-component system, OmpR family, phosphate regulon sensor histidine kinase PhoR
MRKQTAVIFYALAAYVVLQFGWWGLHLIDLTQILHNDPAHTNKRAWMIIGEGTVFFIIVLLGLWKIRSSIKKELELSSQQRNFVLSITHELKTPLSSIKLYLQTLNRRTLDEEKRKELIDKALDEHLRLEHMIENILTASRIENRAYVFHPENVSIKNVINHVTQPFLLSPDLNDKKKNENYNLSAKNVIINCEENLHYYTDKTALESIFSNLVENSLKYAGANPLITINCSIVQSKLHITYFDNGPGIPTDQLSSIFKRFVRLENEDTRQHKGTGLGLYIVDQFVRGQQGSIKVSNKEEGTGLVFEIVL